MSSLQFLRMPSTSHSCKRTGLTLKSLMLIVLCCAVVLGVATYALRAIRHEVRSVRNYYAMSQVTDMLVCHINAQTPEPPRNWKDLEGAYRFVNQGYNMFSIDELREIIGIDFRRLADITVGSDGPIFNRNRLQIVYFNESNHSDIVEANANERLLRHVRSVMAN